MMHYTSRRGQFPFSMGLPFIVLIALMIENGGAWQARKRLSRCGRQYEVRLSEGAGAVNATGEP